MKRMLAALALVATLLAGAALAEEDWRVTP